MIKEMRLDKKGLVVYLLSIFLWQGCISSQVIPNSKEEILEKARYVESLLLKKDTITISKIIRNADPIGIRGSNYLAVIISNYFEMKSENRELNYLGLVSNGISNDGESNFLHIVVPINKKVGCGMFLNFRIVKNNKLELWNINFAYIKDAEDIPMPSFN